MIAAVIEIRMSVNIILLLMYCRDVHNLHDSIHNNYRYHSLCHVGSVYSTGTKAEHNFSLSFLI